MSIEKLITDYVDTHYTWAYVGKHNSIHYVHKYSCEWIYFFIKDLPTTKLTKELVRQRVVWGLQGVKDQCGYVNIDINHMELDPIIDKIFELFVDMKKSIVAENKAYNDFKKSFKESDYKKLLINYVNHVGCVEGSVFLHLESQCLSGHERRFIEDLGKTVVTRDAAWS